MTYFIAHWGYPWVAVVALLAVGVHEKGLRSLNGRSTREHAQRRRRKLWLSYAGLAVLALSISSPLQYWAMEYFWVHMLQHISVMLAAPALYVAGAPLMPLVHAVPVNARRRLLRRAFVRPGRHPLRRVLAALISPFVGIVFFNVVMIVWMLPSVFNPVMARPVLHIGLMLSTFFLSGLLFWVQFIPSAPLKPKLTPFARAGALLVTNLVMTIIAIALSLLVAVPSYHFGLMMMGSMPMRTTTLNPMADQQIGAAILWVCGDLWCYPTLVLALREAMRDDTDSSLMDRIIRGRRSITAEEFQKARAASRSPQ
jgi:cytochrome c oxidase assembly factor CtaG